MGRGDRFRATGLAPDRITPQAADRMLTQMAEHAAEASDETLSSAVITGRRALAEWQDLVGRLRDLEGEYKRLALSESRALGRLQYVLDLLDKLVQPRRSDPAGFRSVQPGTVQPGPAGLAPARRHDPSQEAPGVLAVRLLGVFELTIDGRRVADWRGQRTQSLMQFLAAHRHRNVPRDELIAAVWPDTDEDGGRHRLHQAVYELRRTLHAIDSGRSPVVCSGGGYQLDDQVTVWVDAEEFDDLGSAASRCFAARRTGEAIELGQQALRLYRGDFLCQVTSADWPTVERNRLRARFVQLSIHVGELLAERADHAGALAVIDPVLSSEPWNEDATVIKMACHARTGARSLATAAYRSCAEALYGEFGIAPAARTSRLYDQIRAVEPAGKRGGLMVDRSRTRPRPPSPPASGSDQPSR
jgi:DNA-binding SARP family transcriptional activator